MRPDKPLRPLIGLRLRLRPRDHQDLQFTGRDARIVETSINAQVCRCGAGGQRASALRRDVAYGDRNCAGEKGAGQGSGGEVGRGEHAEEVDGRDIEELDGGEEQDADVDWAGGGHGWLGIGFGVGMREGGLTYILQRSYLKSCCLIQEFGGQAAWLAMWNDQRSGFRPCTLVLAFTKL